MEVFISWSGERSNALARALADLLPSAADGLNVWMSEHDIEAGSRWAGQLDAVLARCNFGVLCMTHDNVAAPWVMYEAGALAKSMSESRVVPYRLELDAEDVPLPLAQFQGVDADKAGTKSLLWSLNLARDKPLGRSDFDTQFEEWWPKLEQRIAAIPPPEGPTPKERARMEMERRKRVKFCSRIAGSWWELVQSNDPEEPVSISFFRIEPANRRTNVWMEGESFDEDGNPVANWKTLAAGIRPDQRIVYYSWEGKHPYSDAGTVYQGVGELAFNPADEQFSRGSGHFADFKVGQDSAQWKGMRLWRESDEPDIEAMRFGSDAEKKEVVLRTLSEWRG